MTGLARLPSAVSGITPPRPPAHVYAERGVLGTLMTRPQLLDSIGTLLRPEHFAEALHGRMYGELARLIVAGKLSDVVGLLPWFEADVDGAKLGRDYLVDLITDMDPLALLPYASLIREAWTRRTIALACRQAIDDSQNATLAIDASLSKLMLAVDRAQDGRVGSTGISFYDANTIALARVADAIAAKGPIGLNYGFPTLRRYCPMLPKKLILLGGHNGIGKSAVGHKMAVTVAKELRDTALRDDVPNSGYVLFISLEMEASDLALRADSIESGVSFEAALSGFPLLAEHEKIAEMAKLRKARDTLGKLPIHYEDCGGMTPGRIAMKARALTNRLGQVKLLVIDYLQQVELEPGSRSGGAFDMASMFKQVMTLKMEFNTTVLVMAQLGREVAKRDGHRPIQQDIGWGGAAEHIADTIILIDRPAYWLAKEKPSSKKGSVTDQEIALSAWQADLDLMEGKAMFIVSKNRGGRADFDVPALFDGPSMDFVEDDNEIMMQTRELARQREERLVYD